MRFDAGGGASLPVVASGDNGEQSVAWVQNGTQVVARHRLDQTALADIGTLSQDAFGPLSGGLEAAADRLGDTAIGFMQDGPDGRRIMVGVYDRPPGAGYGLTSPKARRDDTPTLKWHPGVDLWGPVTFNVLVDEKQVGSTSESSFTVPTRLADGQHLWQVVSVDRRGQQTPMRARALVVDTTPPKVRVKVTGRRTVGGLLRVAVSARDPAGVRALTIDFGDRSPVIAGRSALHRYLRPGRKRITVRATDGARNVGRTQITLTVRK
jgi:hypothetical protein